MLSLILSWVLVPAMKLKTSSKAGFEPIKQKPVINPLFNFKDRNISHRQIQSASISISLILDSSLIKIRNTGHADALNVRIILDGIPIENYPGIINKKIQNTISAQESIVIQTCVGTEAFPSEFIEVIWDDTEASEKLYRISLYN